MAFQSAREFLDHVDQNVSIQDALNEVNWNPRDTAEIAADHGYDVNADDIVAVMGAEWGELSEEQLLNVAGGAPKGKAIVHNDDGTWSPPPGDISGRSCFFGRGGG